MAAKGMIMSRRSNSRTRRYNWRNSRYEAQEPQTPASAGPTSTAGPVRSPSSAIRSTASSARGTTFAVAGANRLAAAAMPDILYNKRAKPTYSQSSAATSKPDAPVKKQGSVNNRQRDSLSLDTDRRCKSKPSGRRSKGGSRAFVPWCQK